MTLATRVLSCLALATAALSLGGCYVEAEPAPAVYGGTVVVGRPAPPPPQGYYVYRARRW